MSSAAQSPGRIAPGTQIAGRFEIVRHVGRGGMSSVYYARERGPEGERDVALKILRLFEPDEDQSVAETVSADFEARFRREAEVLQALDHPNIVRLYSQGETEWGYPYIAMEYIDGPNLDELYRETGPVPPERVIELAIPLVDALRYAHAHGVVHRDVKLSNVLVAEQGGGELLKVVDFGIVKPLEDSQPLTRADEVLGSPYFMAPEQLTGGTIDHRTDIYAFGVLLWRLLTGNYPFTGRDAAEVAMAHVRKPVPSLHRLSLPVEPPVELSHLLRRCLAKSASDRPENMARILGALQGMAGASADDASLAEDTSTQTVTDELTLPGHQKPGLLDRLRKKR